MAVCQGVEEWSAETDAFGAQTEGFDDVCAPSDPAVDVHLET